MASIQDIKNILLGRSYQDELFSSLSGSRRKERGGRETLCNCPFCDDEKGHFSYSSDKPLWKCWKCDKAGDWIDYLKESRGLDFMPAALYLAEQAGVELDGTAADKAKYKAYIRRASILEAAQTLFIAKLKRDDGDKVLCYLKDRGYSDEDIEAMELGAYVDRKQLQEQIISLRHLGYAVQAGGAAPVEVWRNVSREIKDSGLLTQGFGETHTLSILYRDAAGRAIGLACRSILPAGELEARKLQKYKYSYGLTKDAGLIGFSSVRGSEQLILVEGPLDALLLNARGFKAVATGGGASLSACQLQAMQKTGTRELLLAMDMDEPGQQATERIIRSLSTSKLRLYVVSTGKFKDADELVREEGSKAFQECLDKAERASSWYTRMLVSQQDITTDRGLDRAVFNVLEYSANLEDRIERRDAEDSLKAATGLTDEDLATRKQQHEKLASSQKAQASLKATLRQLQQKVEEQDITGAELVLLEGRQAIQQSRGVEAPEPYSLASLLQDISGTTPGLETGYPTLDGVAKIQEGAFTIVAGRPGHCKTAFMVNCLLHQVEKHPDKAFYFFSYEESKARLSVRLLMILADDVIQEQTNKGAYIHYLKAERGQRQKIEKAIQKYEQYTSSGRLILADSMPPGEDLASIIRHVCQRQEVGAIYVDYIQKVSLRKPQSQRSLDIKQVSQLLLEQAVSQNVPIILGAQLGRPERKGTANWQEILSLDNLREAGDIEQDANLVFGLWNDVAGKKLEYDVAGQSYSRNTELRVVCLKNRDGRPDLTRILEFDGATQRITEKQQRWP